MNVINYCSCMPNRQWTIPKSVQLHHLLLVRKRNQLPYELPDWTLLQPSDFYLRLASQRQVLYCQWLMLKETYFKYLSMTEDSFKTLITYKMLLRLQLKILNFFIINGNTTLLIRDYFDCFISK